MPLQLQVDSWRYTLKAVKGVMEAKGDVSAGNRTLRPAPQP
jgi:hypothetical protein